MAQPGRGQRELYDGSAYGPRLQAPRPTWHPQDNRQQQQQQRPNGQRSNLPSQQRAAPRQPYIGAQVNQSSRRQVPDVPQSQDFGSQWPLRDDNAQFNVKSGSRGPPPPRPPRPNQVPVSFNAPRPAPNRGPQPQAIPQYRQDVIPADPVVRHELGEWGDEDYGSPTYPAPNLSRPLTGSSRASTSSDYSVPEFPVPQIPQQIAQGQHQLQSQSLQQTRRPPLGPPPSARRGPLSYYPQTSFVPPIVEETDSVYSQSIRAPHDSYASSNAIPIGISDYYLEDRHAPLTDDESPFDERFEEHSEEDDYTSDHDHVQEVAAVPMRQASVGKRSKPTLTTIKSSESVRPDSQTRPLSTKIMNTMDTPGQNQMTTENVPLEALASVAQSSKDIPLERPSVEPRARTNSSGTLGHMNASSATERALRQQRSRELLAAAREQVRARPPILQAETSLEDPHSHPEKDSAHADAGLGMDEKLNASEKQGSLAQRVGSRRPPRLNVDAVKEAEARGSLTSLPDLIRRATKLASNLDRGRTASRLGMDWFGDGARDSQVVEKRRSGNSLSDILNSFPPPGLATPPGSRGSRHMGQWQSHLRHSALPSESDMDEGKSRNRRCCGMPLWVFILLLTVILLLVAAAVVIPIVLIYLPKQHHSQSGSAALASCQTTLTCENGGTNIIGSSGQCGCLCVNGYTGTTCSEKSTTGCTTADIDGTNNVTLGDAIPRLLTGASSNFSVPLNGSIILDIFSSNNLSCTSENALVTFNGLSARSIEPDVELTPPSKVAKQGSTLVLHERQATSATSPEPAETSNGIVFDNTPTSTSSATSSSASETSSSSSKSTMLDFARVAVLYVMQASGDLQNAVTAQENLQDYFTSGTTSVGAKIDATNVTLTSGYTANLEEHTITTPSGASTGG